MKVEIDIKTLITGFVLGVIFVCVLGVNGSADRASFGFAINPEGYGLVVTENGEYFVVNPNTGMAVQVLTADIDSNPGDRRKSNMPLFPQRPR